MITDETITKAAEQIGLPREQVENIARALPSVIDAIGSVVTAFSALPGVSQAIEKADRVQALLDLVPESERREVLRRVLVVTALVEGAKAAPAPAHPIPCVAALVTDPAGRIALVRTERGWELPGGKQKLGEGWRAALLRELEEELGVQVKLDPSGCAQVRDGMPVRGASYQSVILTVRGRAEGELRPAKGDSVAEARWFAASEVPTQDLSAIATEGAVLAWVHASDGYQSPRLTALQSLNNSIHAVRSWPDHDIRGVVTAFDAFTSAPAMGPKLTATQIKEVTGVALSKWGHSNFRTLAGCLADALGAAVDVVPAAPTLPTPTQAPPARPTWKDAIHEFMDARLEWRRLEQRAAEMARAAGNQVSKDEHAAALMELLRRVRSEVVPPAPAAPECTGLSAMWCPVHGSCTCPHENDNPDCGRTLDDPACPLHAPTSTHEEPVPPGDADAGFEIGDVADDGELKLVLNVGDHRASAWLSEEMWRRMGEVAGWATGERWRDAREAFRAALLDGHDAKDVDRFDERVWRAVAAALEAPAPAPAEDDLATAERWVRAYEGEAQWAERTCGEVAVRVAAMLPLVREARSAEGAVREALRALWDDACRVYGPARRPSLNLSSRVVGMVTDALRARRGGESEPSAEQASPPAPLTDARAVMMAVSAEAIGAANYGEGTCTTWDDIREEHEDADEEEKPHTQYTVICEGAARVRDVLIAALAAPRGDIPAEVRPTVAPPEADAWALRTIPAPHAYYYRRAIAAALLASNRREIPPEVRAPGARPRGPTEAVLRAALLGANNALADVCHGDHEHQIESHLDTLPAEHRRVALAAEKALEILSPVVAEMVEPTPDEERPYSYDEREVIPAPLTATPAPPAEPLRTFCAFDGRALVVWHRAGPWTEAQFAEWKGQKSPPSAGLWRWEGLAEREPDYLVSAWNFRGEWTPVAVDAG